MYRRTPKFSVTTSALLLIAVAAFGFRYAARFLPERRPNELRLEYGEYVKRSIRETVQWFPFGYKPFAEANARGKIVFLDIGTVASFSSKSFSEDYATDGEYRNLLHDHFEAVKIDALELPWLVDALAIENVSFLAGERFLAVAMDHRGGIVDASHLRPMHGDKSMSGWLSEVARLRYADPGEVTKRADESLKKRGEAAVAALSRGPCDEDVVAGWGEVWTQIVEMAEFYDSRLPIATLPMEALAGVGSEEATLKALNLMLELALSPSMDIVEGGSFVFAGASHWRAPIAAKRTGHSLQVAATFAEIGKRYNIPLFRSMAKVTAEWSRSRSHSGVFDSGLGTDQDAGLNSERYNFTEDDIGDLPFVIDENGFPSIEPLEGFAVNVTPNRSEEISRAASLLREIRAKRQGLRTDSGQYANQNGQAISGLFRIARALDDRVMASDALSSYYAAKALFVKPLGDVIHAPDGSGRVTSYLEDHVWMVRAALDGYLATGEPSLLSDAEHITGRMLELFMGQEGALMLYLPSVLEAIGYDLEVYRVDDFDLPSANAVAALNFADLASLTKKQVYRDTAEGIIRAFSGRFSGGAAPAGIVLAGQRLYVNPVSRK